MPIPSEVIRQVDFSGGQVNASALRRDDVAAVATGALALLNYRSEAQGTALTRPGRDALYVGAARFEFCRMSAAAVYHIHFYPPAGGNAKIVITDLAGNIVAQNSSASYLWTASTLWQISVAQGLYQVCVCFPGMQPQVLTWSPANSGWTFAPFAWTTIGGNYQEPFFRFNALGAAMSWSSSTSNYKTVGASLALTCSLPYFTNAMIGSVLSILGGQVQIATVTDSTHATATVLSRLPDTVVFAGVDPTAFSQGQVAATTNSGLKIEVVSIGATTVTGPLMSGRIMPTVGGATADTISSPSASSATSGFTLFSGATQTVQWTEEFMSTLNGWPAAVAFGNDRFIFCQFPQRQEAILWTVIGALTQCYIDSAAAVTDQSAGSDATSGILEFVNRRPKVLNVVDTGDEFIFTDHGVWFIPLAVSGTPLKPGSVAFREITNDGCSPVRPVPLLQSVIYLNAAGDRISVVRATGSITLPYASQDLSDAYSDLFTGPRCIAVSAGDNAPERLAYVVNADGSLVIGKFNEQNNLVGWHPENGVGAANWVVTDIGDVWYSSTYSGGTIIEKEDAADYLDSTILVNSPPANLVVGGKGPFWWLANGTVTLAEGGVDYGDRSIDALGNIVQLQGDVLTDPTLTGGSPISKTYTPVIRTAQPGQDVKQRMRRRSIKNAMITLEANCEFDWGTRRYPAYQFGQDATQPPTFALNSVRERPLGRSYFPSISLTSSRYGQIRLIEFTAEVTV